MIEYSWAPFSSFYKIPSRNGVYVTKENHGFGISIINMGELFGTEFVKHGEGEKVNLSETEKTNSMLEDGDLLFARRSLVESGAGKCSIVYEPTEEMTFESSVIRVRLDNTRANPLFYYYWFKSTVGRRAMKTLVTGSNVKGIKGSELENLLVPNIPIDKQNQIVDFLLRLDKKIILNNTICADLEAMAKQMYDYWFTQYDFPDENGKPYKSSGGKMVFNEDINREIPDGWEVKQLSDIASLETNSVFPDNHTYYNHYSIPAYDDNKTPAYEIGSSIASNKYLVEHNSILVSKLNPQFKRIWLAKNPPEHSICSTEFLPIKSNNSEMPFLYSVLCSDSFSVHLVQKATSSTGSRKRIDPTNCLSFEFAYNEDIANKYSEIMNDCVERIEKIPVENKQLSELRDFLLPMLMNGQIKIGT